MVKAIRCGTRAGILVMESEALVVRQLDCGLPVIVERAIQAHILVREEMRLYTSQPDSPLASLGTAGLPNTDPGVAALQLGGNGAPPCQPKSYRDIESCGTHFCIVLVNGQWGKDQEQKGTTCYPEISHRVSESVNQ
jgi:hypothetical protein